MQSTDLIKSWNIIKPNTNSNFDAVNSIVQSWKLWIKEIQKLLKAYIKIEKLIKFGDFEIQKQKFHEHKGPISIKNIDITTILVSDKVSFGKKGFKYFIGYKDTKKLDLYVYFLQKWAYIEETLTELNIYLFNKRG